MSLKVSRSEPDVPLPKGTHGGCGVKTKKTSPSLQEHILVHRGEG